MTSLPRISVVTPSFNQAAFLRETLDSLLEQAYPELEIIVMDGGSSDGSVDILRAYSPHLAYWVSEPDRGQAHALNTGFARATGSVMTWLNSDDLLLPGALAAVGAIFAQYPAVRWLTGQRAYHIGGRVRRAYPPRAGRISQWARRGWYHGRGLGFIQQEGTFWRRDLWEQAGGSVDENRHYSMDYALWRRFAVYTDLVTLDRALGAFRVHEAQKTRDLNAYYREAGIRVPAFVRYATLPLRFAINGLIWSAFAPRIVWRDERWQAQHMRL